MKTINTWLDGYLELRHRAFADRGAIELADGTRWPRTTGEQVAAIAAAFTPAIRAERRAARREPLARDARRHPARRARRPPRHVRGQPCVLGTLEAVAVYLDNLALRPPAERAWMALFAVIDADDTAEPRNAGPSGDGPFKHFDGVQTYDDLYNAEFKYLRDLRGFDQMKPDGGAAGVERPIPRTTNADVHRARGLLDRAARRRQTDHGHRWRHRDVARGDRRRRPTRPRCRSERGLREEQRVLASALDDGDPRRSR